MIVTVASYKGGVGKTNTAIHIAAYLQTIGPTLLVDGDAIRASLKWSRRGSGAGLPVQGRRRSQPSHGHAGDSLQIHCFRYLKGNPSPEALQSMADGCDLLVIPAVPQTAASDGLFFTLEELQKLGIKKHKVLLNLVKHNRKGEADELREALDQMKIPRFATEIPELAAFDKANAQGVPVFAADDKQAQRAWKLFQSVGKEIVNGKA